MVYRRRGADVDTGLRLVENLLEPLERGVRLDPAEAVVIRPEQRSYPVGIRTMQAGLRASEPLNRFLILRRTFREPEFTFAGRPENKTWLNRVTSSR